MIQVAPCPSMRPEQGLVFFTLLPRRFFRVGLEAQLKHHYSFLPCPTYCPICLILFMVPQNKVALATDRAQSKAILPTIHPVLTPIAKGEIFY